MKIIHFGLSLLFLLFSHVGFAAEPDAKGCKDPALLSRFPGFRIQRCTLNDFGAHTFLEAGSSAPQSQKTGSSNFESLMSLSNSSLQEGQVKV